MRKQNMLVTRGLNKSTAEYREKSTIFKQAVTAKLDNLFQDKTNILSDQKSFTFDQKRMDDQATELQEALLKNLKISGEEPRAEQSALSSVVHDMVKKHGIRLKERSKVIEAMANFFEDPRRKGPIGGRDLQKEMGCQTEGE